VVTSQIETSGAFSVPTASTAFGYALGGGIEVPVARHCASFGIGLPLLTLFLVTPGRWLRTRDDARDVRVLSIAAGGRFGRAPLFRFQPARSLLLLLFLLRALARALVLRGSRLLHGP